MNFMPKTNINFNVTACSQIHNYWGTNLSINWGGENIQDIMIVSDK